MCVRGCVSECVKKKVKLGVDERLSQHKHTLTNCSEHITTSVHLPSHFPILEGSGRGLGPRRLRGNDGSPDRSRLPNGLSSHHPRLDLSCSLVSLSTQNTLDVLQSDGRMPRSELILSVNTVMVVVVSGRGTSSSFAGVCGSTATDYRIASATPSGGARGGTHKGTKRDRKLSLSACG